jgi:hypothetical protein
MCYYLNVQFQGQKFNIQKIKTRQPAPPQSYWKSHTNVTKFQLENAFAFASACLVLKTGAIYSPENPVAIYLSAQRNISVVLSTSLSELKISLDTRWYNNSLFYTYQQYTYFYT